MRKILALQENVKSSFVGALSPLAGLIPGQSFRGLASLTHTPPPARYMLLPLRGAGAMRRVGRRSPKARKSPHLWGSTPSLR